LRTVDRPRALGLLIQPDDSAARVSARVAAAHAREVAEATTELSQAVREHLTDAEARFDRALALVYVQPKHARDAFEHALKSAGPEQVTQMLREHPDRLGSLIRTQEMLAGHDSPTARIAAGQLADRAAELIEAREAGSAAIARAQAAQHVSRSRERQQEITRAIEHVPGENLLKYAIARGLRQLEPQELRQLRRVLTNPQRALAFKIGEKIREVALGRDDIEL